MSLLSITDPIRVDRLLRQHYPKLTQGIIEKLLRNKKILLQMACGTQVKIKSNYRVEPGQSLLIEIDLNSYSMIAKNNFSSATISLANKLTSEYLLDENQYFIAINKPAGLAVQGGSKISISVDEALQYLNSITSNNFKLVHRLDKNTSGVLLIAKQAENARKLTESFKQQLIGKTYYAALGQLPEQNTGKIANYLAKLNHDGQELVQIVAENHPQAKYAETEYQLIKSSGNYSFVKFSPKTGRMHQLRVHAAHLNCPILGDSKYGGQKYHRLMLHAAQLVISEQIFGKKFIVAAPLPADFNNLGFRL